MVLTFDTHAVVKQLVAAGFTDQQAEAVKLVVREAHDVDLSNLVTKTEHQAGLAASKADLQAVRADLEKSLAETKADILKWMIGTIGIQTVVIIGTVLTPARAVLHWERCSRAVRHKARHTVPVRMAAHPAVAGGGFACRSMPSGFICARNVGRIPRPRPCR